MATFVVHSLGCTNYAEVTSGGMSVAYYNPCEGVQLLLPHEQPPKATNMSLGCIDAQELFWEIFRDFHPILLALKRGESMQGNFWVYNADVSAEVWKTASLAIQGAQGEIPALVELHRRNILPIPEEVTFGQILWALKHGFPPQASLEELMNFLHRHG